MMFGGNYVNVNLTPFVQTHIFHSKFEPSQALVLGGKINGEFNGKVMVGLSFKSKISALYYSEPKQAAPNTQQKMSLGYGYGGLYLGYVVLPQKRVHFNISNLFGLGRIKQYEYYGSGSRNKINATTCFVLEPMFNIVVNANKKLRIETGIGARMISAQKLVYLKAANLDGLIIQLCFKLGQYC